MDFAFVMCVFGIAQGFDFQRLREDLNSSVIIYLADSFDSQYYVNFTLGTPPQNFTVAFATSSLGSWIASVDCACAFCEFHSVYDSSESLTADVYTDLTFSNLIFNRDVVGTLASDTAHIGSSPMLLNFFFLIASTVENYPVSTALYDGVIGIGASQYFSTNKPTFLEYLYIQGFVSSRVFSIYYGMDPSVQSRIIIGGSDPSLYTGDLTEHPNRNNTGLWQLQVTDIKVGIIDVPMTTNIAVIDSSQTGLIFPQAMQAALQKYTTVNNNCSNKLVLPALVLTIDGVKFTIGHDEYVIQASSGTSKSCSTTIYSAAYADDLNLIVLGDSFLKAYYSYFDMDNQVMKFAEAA